MRGFESTAWRDPASVRKTMKGSGMVSPAESVTVSYQSGRSELLKAGITRLSPDHPLVKQRPGLFRPCDKATVERMRQYAERVLERPRTPARTPPRSSTSRKPPRNRLR